MYICIDCQDGGGKTTVAAALSARLRELQNDVEETLEPGGSEHGETLREIILHGGVTPITRALLYLADRKETNERIVKPALHAGRIVVTARSMISSFVYQGELGGLGDLVYPAHRSAGLVVPDITFIIDTDQDVIDKRLAARDSLDDVERATTPYRSIIADLYRNGAALQEKAIGAGAWQVIVVDGNRSVDDVVNSMLEEIVKHGTYRGLPL